MLQSMGSQGVRHDLATEQHQIKDSLTGTFKSVIGFQGICEPYKIVLNLDICAGEERLTVLSWEERLTVLVVVQLLLVDTYKKPNS